jgi:hypothetical protein
MKKLFATAALGLLGLLLFAQEQDHEHAQGGAAAQGELGAATEAMGRGHHHESHEHMGAHMHMTSLRKPQPRDALKAQQVAEQARQALEHYRDYQVALDEGFKIFLPNVPQKMYHFTKWEFAVGEAFRFDPSKPTSLLYEKQGSGYKLIGAMYTAPVRFSEEQLNERVPLSMAQWHQHVNMCKPPRGREMEMLGKSPRFGLNGSISTEQECDAVGGTFMPHVFGWMVHVYPWEKTPDEIWSVERQLDKSAEHHGHGDMAGMEHKH